MASVTRRSSWAVPTFPATAATWASTHAAASIVRAGVAWAVASATSRARHAGTCPAWTAAQSRGRRCRSSRALPISRFAATDRDAQDCAELGAAELRHQRRPGSGEGFFVLAARDREPGGGVDRLRWVQVSPLRSEGQDGPQRPVLGRTFGLHCRQHRGRRTRLRGGGGGGGHDSIQQEPTDSGRSRKCPFHRGFETGLRPSSTSERGGFRDRTLRDGRGRPPQDGAPSFLNHRRGRPEPRADEKQPPACVRRGAVRQDRPTSRSAEPSGRAVGLGQPRGRGG